MQDLVFRLRSRLSLPTLGRQMRSWGTRRTASDSPSLRKRLGQHLLVNPATLRFIAESAGIQPSDHVLEIGPGTGNLTVHLLERAGAVTAVELDERMCQHLKQRMEDFGPPLSERLAVRQGDALLAPWPEFDLCVANVPYQISSPLLGRMASHPYRKPPRALVLLVQKEFAARVAAQPGGRAWGRLAVGAELLAGNARRLLRHVPPTEFRPPPKVDSAVVEVLPRQMPEIPLTEHLDDDPLPSLRADGRTHWMRRGWEVKPEEEGIRVGGLRSGRAVTGREWAGLLRFAFSGKNKTIRSLVGSRRNCERLAAAATAARDGEQVGSPGAHAYRHGLPPRKRIRRSLGGAGGGLDGVADARERARDAAAEAGVENMRANAMRAADFQRLLLAFHAKGLRLSGYGAAGDGGSLEELAAMEHAREGAEMGDGDAELAEEKVDAEGGLEGATRARARASGAASRVDARQ